MKVFKDIIQGSPEWKLLRKARPTASGFSEIVTPKGETSKSAKGYMRELIAEAFCPEYEYFAGNRYTEQGKLMEPEAREAFIAHTGLNAEQVGFCLSDDGVCGCSPDLLVVMAGEYVGGCEIKVPSPKTHVSYVLDGVLPDEYKAQVHSSMAITGIRTWSFWSYFPGLKPLHVVTVWDAYTDKINAARQQFVADYKAAMADALPKLKLQ